MGLEQFITDSEDEELPPDHCPSCEQKGEVTEYWYNRCTTSQDDCEVTSWIPTQFEHGLDVD